MASPTFDTLYKTLNKAQKQAVDAIDGPVMVIAGPGTGKTHILSLRISNILKQTDTPANGILAITYTEAGVKAIRAKLKTIIGDRAHDVRIHTFHGFASSVMAEYPDHFLHVSDLKQMTDIEQESLIRNIISNPKFSTLRPAGKPDAYVSGIIRGIDDAKRDALTPEMVRQYAKDEAERIKNDESSISTRGATKGQLKADAREAIEKCERTELFSEVYKLYEEKKKEAKKMDFNDLIIELLLSLRHDELLLRLLQERYLYIHVDEHQDTNDAQNFIVSMIAEFFDTPNIFVVGDEKQAIYRFQGASVENFLLLQKRWPAMKVISLDTNYRSHQSILDASFGMIEKNYIEDENKDLRIRLTSGSQDNPRPIDIVTGENVSSIELYLVKALKELEPGSTAAIIVRRNRDVDRIIRLLELHDIPVSSERSIDIFNHPAGRLFFNLIEYLCDSSKIDTLAKTIIAGMWKLRFEDSTTLVRALNSGNLSELENKLPALDKIKKNILSDSSVGFLIHAAEESGFISLIAKDPSCVHVWRGIVTLAESLARESRIVDPMQLMNSLLEYRTSAESRPVKISVGAPDFPIQAMTAHGSKGLEFDYVFIPYATEEAWVGKARGASFVLPKKQTTNSDVRDIRRLFYVAITRARKHATILTATEESDGRIITPIRFLDELDPAHISHVALPRVGAEDLYVNANISKSSFIPLADIAKDVLLKKGLSVTALNHFLECPNKFIYQSILKMPQAPSASAEKGTAMHSALAAIWKSELRSAKDMEAILNEKITEHFNESFLPTLEKESAKKELVEKISAVSNALESHFSIPKNASVFTESWVESPFSNINLHGKLDVIVDNGNEVFIYDYKTKRVMSVNAIKGETKTDADGNYFRQLVFYKILASSDHRWRNRKITPALVFVSPDEKGRCPTVTLPIEIADIEKVKVEIQSLIDSVWSGKILEEGCRDEKCEWCGLRSL